MKVSFDFDSTLSRTAIQKYAKTLIQSGHDVWIVTSRLHESKAPNLEWNDDLYAVGKDVGVPKWKIHFTNGTPKYPFLKEQEFLWHLDDDWFELKDIQRHTKVIPISCFGNSTWEQKCTKIINKGTQ